MVGVRVGWGARGGRWVQVGGWVVGWPGERVGDGGGKGGVSVGAGGWGWVGGGRAVVVVVGGGCSQTLKEPTGICA